MIAKVIALGVVCVCIVMGQNAFEQLNNPDAEVRLRALGAVSKLGPTPEVLRALSGSTKDQRPDVRRVSCSLLGYFRSDARPAVPVLIEALNDANEEVQIAAAQALGEIGPASIGDLPSLVNLLRHRNDGIRRAAAYGLQGMGRLATPAADDLLASAGDPSSDVRESAIAALGRIGAHVEAVLAALDDREGDVRRAAVNAIPEFAQASERAIAPLIKALRDPDSNVQSTALGALFKVGRKHPHAVVPAFREVLSNAENHFALRSGAADYLAAMGEPAKAAIPDLLRALDADHDWVRRGARRALKLLGADPNVRSGGQQAPVTETVPEPAAEAAVLIDALRKGDGAAEEQLAKLRGGAVAGLLALLDDPGPARLGALRVLARIENRAVSAIPSIAKLVSSGDVETQRAAVRALGSIRVPSDLAVKTLANATKIPSLRSDALGAIRGMGANAAGALPALIPLLNSADTAAIGETLGAIREMEAAAEPAVHAMIPLLSSKDAGIRASTVYAFGAMWAGAAPALPALVRVLDDTDARIRTDALSAINHVFGDCCADRSRVAAQGRKILPRVLKLTADPHVDVRENAVRTVGWIGIAESAVFRSLEAGFQDSSSTVRGAAATATGVLRRLSGKGDALLPCLFGALDDPEPLVRRWAVVALRNFGKAANTAIPRLDRLSAESDAEMQRVVDETLTVIRTNDRSKREVRENPTVMIR